MRLDNIAGSAAPYVGPRPDVAPAPRRAEPATQVTPAPALLRSAPSAEDSGRKSEQPNVTNEDLNAINEKLFRVNRRMVLYKVDGTNEMSAKVIDTQTNEVVETIPPEALVKLRARLRDMSGILVDK